MTWGWEGWLSSVADVILSLKARLLGGCAPVIWQRTAFCSLRGGIGLSCSSEKTGSQDVQNDERKCLIDFMGGCQKTKRFKVSLSENARKFNRWKDAKNYAGELWERLERCRPEYRAQVMYRGEVIPVKMRTFQSHSIISAHLSQISTT